MKRIAYIVINIILCGLCIGYMRAIADTNNSITDLDIKIIKYADTYSASYVINKIRNIYENNGKESISSVVPAVSEKVLLMSKKVKTEADFEILMEYIWILNVTADKRAIPALLSMLPCEGVYSGKNYPQALYNYGNYIIPILVDSLNSNSKITTNHVALTLKRLKELDVNDNMFSDNDNKLIRDKLIMLASNDNIEDKYLLINALCVFGDETSLKALNEIKNKDKYIIKKMNNEILYLNRYGSEEAINSIKKRYEK